jgi:hypothetical protein
MAKRRRRRKMTRRMKVLKRLMKTQCSLVRLELEEYCFLLVVFCINVDSG